MSISQQENVLGRLALHYKLVTAEQLQHALQLQKQSGGRTRLGQVLLQQGYISEAKLEQLLQVQRSYLAKQSGLDQATKAGAPPAPKRVEVDTGVEVSLEDLLRSAMQSKASDVHIHSLSPLKMRLAGRLTDVSEKAIASAQAEKMLQGVLSDDERAQLDRHGQVDLAYALEGVGRFRVNIYRQQRGLDGVFRAIPSQVPTLAELNLPERLAEYTTFHQGMVLCTGPSGSGKSTTMAALVDLVNGSRSDHILTVEEPIEFVHPSKGCVVNQRQVGPHTQSFARALKAALREDPDIIVIGELRDLETISLALTAAETGHFVLGTLHTGNAIRTVNRLAGVFPPDQQPQIRTMMSESIKAIVSQRLVRRADGRGRVPAYEILVVTGAVGNLIRENKTFQIQSVLQTGRAHGMCLLDDSLADLVKDGTITKEEARLHGANPKRFQ